MINEFSGLELKREESEDVAADLNAEILTAIEYQRDRNITNADDINCAEIIFDTIDNFLKQYNGKASRHEALSDDEIYNVLAEKDGNLGRSVKLISDAIALYLEDKNLI